MKPARIPPKTKNVVRSEWGLLWDDMLLENGAWTGEKVFYTVPQGQANKTKSDTNMTQSGQLPRGKSFMVWYIKFGVTGWTQYGFDPSVGQLFSCRGYFELRRNNIAVFSAPLVALPADMSPVIAAQDSTIGASDHIQFSRSGDKSSPYGYRLQEPKTLEALESFSVHVFWDDTITLANVETVTTKLYIIMHGLFNVPV